MDFGAKTAPNRSMECSLFRYFGAGAPFGVSLVRFGPHLAPFWSPRVPFRLHFGPLRYLLGSILDNFGRLGHPSGSILVPRAPFWHHFGRLGHPLGSIFEHFAQKIDEKSNCSALDFAEHLRTIPGTSAERTPPS